MVIDRGGSKFMQAFSNFRAPEQTVKMGAVEGIWWRLWSVSGPYDALPNSRSEHPFLAVGIGNEAEAMYTIWISQELPYQFLSRPEVAEALSDGESCWIRLVKGATKDGRNTLYSIEASDRNPEAAKKSR